jgi:thymidylate synthase (FAD)
MDAALLYLHLQNGILYMKCNLIALSKPSEHVDCDTAEELVAYCARISNPANQANKSTATKLVEYLIRNNHWSPLEMVHMVIEIETTRDIARQILRHGSFKFQEFSQRYAEVLDFAEPREARLQDTKNRQNSIEIDDAGLDSDWRYDQRAVIKVAEAAYKRALEAGIAKEVARSVLPEGLTTSRLYMAGTLRSWIHYCQLRMGNGTQKEHQEIAQACWAIVAAEFPSIANVFAPDELEDLVKEFSVELLKKLKYQRDVKGYEGWNDDSDWGIDDMWEALDYQIEKGDPIDAAAYAAFIYDREKRNG